MAACREIIPSIEVSPNEKGGGIPEEVPGEIEANNTIQERLNAIETKYSLEFRQYLQSFKEDRLEAILNDDTALEEEYGSFEWLNIFYENGIIFTADEDIFPANWYQPDIDAKAESLAGKEIERSREIVLSALAKYPIKVLKENLAKLYVLKSLNFYGVDYGGTYMGDQVYMANNGMDMGYTDQFMEQEFHHEFSSVLLINYYHLFKEPEWYQLNPVDFIYFDEQTGGASAIKTEKVSVEFNPDMHEEGFLYEYAQSTLENDFNSFAENLFVNDGDFFEIVEGYEKLSLKLDLIIDFYNSIDPDFTLEYFKEISFLEPGLIETEKQEEAPTIDPEEETPSYNKLEREYFFETAFGSEFGESHSEIHKWTDNIRIKVIGTPTSVDLESLDQVLSELNSLIDSISLDIVTHNSNIDMHFTTIDNFSSIEPDYVPGNMGFFWGWWDNNGAIYKGKILIAIDGISQQERSHLIREELTQSLGLMNDSYWYENSIFYQEWTDTIDYAPIDRAIISLLYDSRLKPGMTKEQVIDVLGKA